MLEINGIAQVIDSPREPRVISAKKGAYISFFLKFAGARINFDPEAWGTISASVFVPEYLIDKMLKILQPGKNIRFSGGLIDVYKKGDNVFNSVKIMSPYLIRNTGLREDR